MLRISAALAAIATAPLWLGTSPAKADVVVVAPRVTVVARAPGYVPPRVVRVYPARVYSPRPYPARVIVGPRLVVVR